MKNPKKDTSRLNVVMFTGGRGSTALASQLSNAAEINLTLAINGYDDGLSTGEVRRFLGDSLGPSDFRKNASRIASLRNSCNLALIEFLDLRFPDDVSLDTVTAIEHVLCHSQWDANDIFIKKVSDLLSKLDEDTLTELETYYGAFLDDYSNSIYGFNFDDCSVGNLIFAGCFLSSKRSFNQTVERYSKILGIPSGVIVNVTNGENAYLVAIDRDGKFLESEANIVDDQNLGRIKDFYLINSSGQAQQYRKRSGRDLIQELDSGSAKITLNPALSLAVEHADLILYAPGTQYSSLFPSYITPGLGKCISQNLHALKLLITNLYEDAETRDASATEIIDRALYYLREKGHKEIPAPFLVTHYLVNVPDSVKSDHIPVGHIDSIEDPRLVRIGNFEEGISGRHHAEKILTPFVKSLTESRLRPTVAVLLMESKSIDKATQTMLELIRARVGSLSCDITVYHLAPIPENITKRKDLPFKTFRIEANSGLGDKTLIDTACQSGADYICLFESSGMYHGHDIVNLAANIDGQHLDAVWGSRRLSRHDMKASYRFRYKHHAINGMISALGSHALSAAYLFRHGRYISDTLSGLRLVKTVHVQNVAQHINHPCFNQFLLSELLKSGNKVFELPVEFLPISPEKVKRTSISEGLRSLWVIFWPHKQRVD